MSLRQPNVSIVIPVYNEEQQLAACLDAITRQTVAPLEVVIVDNNCTDQSMAIARKYPFVRVVKEGRKGLAYARNCGFDAARGDIIGRIDADSRLMQDWVARVQQIFENPSIDAVSGSIGFHDTPFPLFFGRLDGFFRRYLARNLDKHNELFLYGGNMAMRQGAWKAVKSTLCLETIFHEDMDMAAHLAHGSIKIVFDENLHARISARRVDSNWSSYYAYVVANGRTYAAHKLKGRYFMYPVEWLVLLCYLPLRTLYRSYDPTTRRLSCRKLIRPTFEQRISPIVESTQSMQ